MTTIAQIPTQCPPHYIEKMAKTAASLTGQGVVVELGAWLGATTAAMAAHTGAPIHAFDYFQARGAEPTKAAESGIEIKPGENTLPWFFANVRSRNVIPHAGSILDAQWEGWPVELYVDDACKTGPVFAHAMRTFGPSFVPGVTRLALLDYNWLEDYHQRFNDARRSLYRYQIDFMHKHAEHFERINGDPAIFLYVKRMDFSHVRDYGNVRFHRAVHRIVQWGRRHLRSRA